MNVTGNALAKGADQARCWMSLGSLTVSVNFHPNILKYLTIASG
jgi:hypothetical protein